MTNKSLKEMARYLKQYGINPDPSTWDEATIVKADKLLKRIDDPRPKVFVSKDTTNEPPDDNIDFILM